MIAKVTGFVRLDPGHPSPVTADFICWSIVHSYQDIVQGKATLRPSQSHRPNDMGGF